VEGKLGLHAACSQVKNRVEHSANRLKLADEELNFILEDGTPLEDRMKAIEKLRNHFETVISDMNLAIVGLD